MVYLLFFLCILVFIIGLCWFICFLINFNIVRVVVWIWGWFGVIKIFLRYCMVRILIFFFVSLFVLIVVLVSVIGFGLLFVLVVCIVVIFVCFFSSGEFFILLFIFVCWCRIFKKFLLFV